MSEDYLEHPLYVLVSQLAPLEQKLCADEIALLAAELIRQQNEILADILNELHALRREYEKGNA